MLGRWAARLLEGRGFAVIAKKRIRWVQFANGQGAWVILGGKPPAARAPARAEPRIHDLVGDDYSFVPSTDGANATIFSNLPNVLPGDFIRMRHDDGTPALYRLITRDLELNGCWRGELEYAE